LAIKKTIRTRASRASAIRPPDAEIDDGVMGNYVLEVEQDHN
jgi:hypothetical protein